MVRVLHVYPQMNNAGTEKVIFNLYENIDTSKVQFDFLVERPGELDEKIVSMGGNIHYLNEKSKHSYYKKIVALFTAHTEYKIVHTHTHARMATVLKAAKKCNIPCRIAHSHNARNDLPKIIRLIKGITSIPIELSANHFYACSSNAAKWLFPHRFKDCSVLYNGIKTQKFLYKADTRTALRKELGLPDNRFVMIHIGRFAEQKNHEFLIKILASYKQKYGNDWSMLLVGVGPLQDQIKNQVYELGLSDNIMFLNNRNDVNELLSVADCFVFPSLHEGLGIVVIESQAAFMPCIASDAVPDEADMGLGLLTRIPLSFSTEVWADQIEATKKNNITRAGHESEIFSGNYNIETIAAKMQNFYLEQCK